MQQRAWHDAAPRRHACGFPPAAPAAVCCLVPAILGKFPLSLLLCNYLCCCISTALGAVHSFVFPREIPATPPQRPKPLCFTSTLKHNMEDDKDRQAVMELQEKLEMSRSFLKMVVSQARNTTLTLKRAELTITEVEALPDDVVSYKPVGKA